MKTKTYPKPFVKWAGGKRGILEHIIRHLPQKWHTYIEPFVGGGAVLFHLLPAQAIISDINGELINAYTVIRENPRELISLLQDMKAKHSKDYYYYIRDQFEPRNRVERAARFIYLNRTCFNGLWRVNKKGKFNVPIGRYKNPQIVDPDNIMAIHKYLTENNIRILQSDFKPVVKMAKPGDLVYFDPPYLPAEGSSKFTSYTSGGFGLEDHIRLSEVFRQLAYAGVFVILSNSDTPIVRKLYRGFRIIEITTTRYINSRGNARNGWKELLILGWS